MLILFMRNLFTYKCGQLWNKLLEDVKLANNVEDQFIVSNFYILYIHLLLLLLFHVYIDLDDLMHVCILNYCCYCCCCC